MLDVRMENLTTEAQWSSNLERIAEIWTEEVPKSSNFSKSYSWLKILIYLEVNLFGNNFLCNSESLWLPRQKDDRRTGFIM